MNKYQYCKPTQCPDCKKYHVVKCSHALTGSQTNSVSIFISSDEYILLELIEKDFINE